MGVNRILTVDRMRKVRYIAENVDSVTKLLTYIDESELFDIAPAITQELYTWLVTNDFAVGDSWIYTTPSGKDVIVSSDMYNDILNGSYYDCNCQKGISMGLIRACAYYAYERALVEGNINLTSFGVVSKRSEDSNVVSDKQIQWSAGKAGKNGAEAVRGVVEHLKCLGLIECKVQPYTRRKMIIIGD